MVEIAYAAARRALIHLLDVVLHALLGAWVDFFDDESVRDIEKDSDQKRMQPKTFHRIILS